jgi:hypothetical protein
MNVLNIRVIGKTYTTERITCGLSREAMRINYDALAFAKDARNASENLDREEFAAVMLNKSLELSDRKLNLVCRVYGNQFSVDDLENSLTSAEIDTQLNQIVLGVSGIASKN